MSDFITQRGNQEGGYPVRGYPVESVELMTSITPLDLATVNLSSPIFGTDGNIFVTPTIFPTLSPDSIIPPSVLKVKNVNMHLGSYGFGTSLLIPSDIYIPSFSIVSDILSLRTPHYIYDDVCNTPSIREKVSKIIYYKFLDKWLYDNDESKYLLGYLKISDGKVQLIKDLDNKDDYKNNSQDVVDKKVDYIENNIISIGDIYTILQKFTESTHISWCELSKDTFFIRESIEKTLEKKFKRMIIEK